MIRVLIFLMLIANGVLSQGFFTAIEQNEDEPNKALHLALTNTGYVLAGQYFSGNAGRWTGYYGKYSFKGDLENLLVEEIDTVVQLSANGNLLSNGNRFSALGSYRDSIYLFTYDIASSSIHTNNFLNRLEYNFTGGGIVVNDQNETILCGRNYIDDSEVRNVTVLKIANGLVTKYTESSLNSRNVAGNVGINSRGEIVVSCLKSREPGTVITDKSYVIILDNDLEELHNSNSSGRVSPMRLNSGFLIDSEDNIIMTGTQAEEIPGGLSVFFPSVAKFAPDGNHLWTKRIGSNTYNIQGWGRWNTVIEAIDQDGYIVVGSSCYQTQDTVIANSAIAKISYEGEEIWHRTYEYEKSHRLVEELTDIIVHKGSYVACGSSSNFSSPERPPWLKSLIIKVDSEGILDTMGVSTTNQVKSEIIIYPNPAKGLLYLQNVGEYYRIELYNSKGLRVDLQKNETKKETMQLDVSGLNDGIYYLNLFTKKNEKIVQSVVIQN